MSWYIDVGLAIAWSIIALELSFLIIELLNMGVAWVDDRQPTPIFDKLINKTTNWLAPEAIIRLVEGSRETCSALFILIFPTVVLVFLWPFLILCLVGFPTLLGIRKLVRMYKKRRTL